MKFIDDEAVGPSRGADRSNKIALLGAALVGAGLMRRSLGGVLMAVVGAALVAPALGRDVVSGARRRSAAEDTPAPNAEDIVDEASEESFPASDPPSHAAPGHLGRPDNEGRSG